MRGQLAENNQQLWKMLEEEKALRAAIAHDIRSPLSLCWRVSGNAFRISSEERDKYGASLRNGKMKAKTD